MSRKGYKKCQGCGRNRAERFFVGKRGRICSTCRKKSRRKSQHDAHIRNTYGITPEQYWAIYEAQGGRCALCRKATGKSKALAVDHDHSCCDGQKSCGRCVRSLTCSKCNKMLGHMRDDPEFAERVLLYLIHPPGKELLREWNALSKDAQTSGNT